MLRQRAATVSPPAGSVGTVLALRALGLGDALTGIPALRGLRRAFPGSRLVLAAPPGPGGWLARLGVVDDVVDARGLGGPPHGVPRPAVAVNLHGRGPQSHRLLQALEPARLVAFRNDEAGHAHGPVWPGRSHEVDRWCRLVASAGGACGREDLRLHLDPGIHRTRVVVAHPGAASGSRRWPAERWQQVVRRLVDTGHHVVVTGGPGERELCGRVAAAAHGVRDLAGMLDLDHLAELVGSAGLLLCGDTGVAHLATAYATPSVLLFGPTPPATWGPAIDPELHTVLWHGDEARPGDPHAAETDPALGRITVEEVLAAAEDLLGARTR